MILEIMEARSCVLLPASREWHAGWESFFRVCVTTRFTFLYIFLLLAAMEVFAELRIHLIATHPYLI